MPAQLMSLNEGPNILIDKPILLIGRHPECDIQIDSRKISRRHCCIAQVNDYLVVRDLDSTNGIRINGKAVVEGKLLPGDELTVGNHCYRLVWQDAPARAHTPAGRGPGTPVHPSAAARASDDDLLESCDEPVALPDPRRPALHKPPVRPPSPPLARGMVKQDEDSVVLPNDGIHRPGKGSIRG